MCEQSLSNLGRFGNCKFRGFAHLFRVVAGEEVDGGKETYTGPTDCEAGC